MQLRGPIRFGILLLLGSLIPAAPPSSSLPPMLGILSQELDRNWRALRESADPKPYFISYSVNEVESESIEARGGALQSRGKGHGRTLDVVVRVGSPELDNYHLINGDRPRFVASGPIPVGDEPYALRMAAWRQTDGAWRAAADRLLQVKTSSGVAADKGKQAGDFSPAPVVNEVLPVARYQVNMEDWIARLRRVSGEFNQFGQILSSSVSLTSQREVKTFLDTEGTRLQHGRNFFIINITARAKAVDGQDLVTLRTFEAEDPSKLPKDAQLIAEIQRMAQTLNKMLLSQPASPFVGPAILSGRAAAVFFHETFGHRVEGHRETDENEGQTFGGKIGQKVMPEIISVTADPTRRRSESIDLNGWYEYDDQGVKAEKVDVVKKGVFESFLMSRTPIPGFPKSNSHGRKQAGFAAVSRQSNLLVESSKRVSSKELRSLLMEEVKRQNKPYGLYFEEVTGGLTTTQRRGLQAFTVVPLVVYKVYADGRPDELVRGADIVGTPLTSLTKILAASDESEVFNGFCGAESGSVPVSAIAPALLVSEIEIQRKPNQGDRPPLLPRPNQGGAQ